VRGLGLTRLAQRLPSLGALVLLGGAVFLLLRGGDDESAQNADGASVATPGDSVTARVLEVIDGDTIDVSLGGETEPVRYIGIDTPESNPDVPYECFGDEADRLNRELVGGREVKLTFDDERRDQYGRLLAYVYVDELFVNAEIVRRGYARTLTIEPNTDHADLLARLQQEAGNAGRGLWGAC
jgi:micrococcal nuclease